MQSYLDLTFRTWLNHRLDPDGLYGDFIGGLEKADTEMALKRGWGITLQMLENALKRCEYVPGSSITKGLVDQFSHELEVELDDGKNGGLKDDDEKKRERC